MTVLIIDNSSGFTGAFKCAFSEAALLSEVHKFIFVVPRGSTNTRLLKEKGFTVYELPLKEISKSPKAILKYPFFLLSNIFRLKKIIRAEKVDVVQVNDFYNLLGAGVRMLGGKVGLITYVRFLPSSLPSFLKDFWLQMAQQFGNYVIAVSDAVLDQLPRRKNTVRIYDPVLLEEGMAINEAHNSNTFLYLANFTRGKGQEYALQAFAKAYEQNRNLRLRFVGGDLGLEKNRLFKKELQDTAQSLHLDQVVLFSDFECNVEKLIKDSWALLNFSDAESFSMTCLEASFYGTPVIATKSGGPEEIIENEVSGLLVEKKDIDQMSSAILRIASDNSLRTRFSLAGRGLVRQRFAVDSFKEKFLMILDSMNK